MQDHNFGFYEEPVPFDYYEETKHVADALAIPIAGGRGRAEPAPVPLDDRERRAAGRAAGHVLLRRDDAGLRVARMAEAAGPGMHAPHVGQRPRVPLRRPLRLVRAGARAAPGVQGNRRAPRVLTDLAAAGREGRGARADRTWPRHASSTRRSSARRGCSPRDRPRPSRPETRWSRPPPSCWRGSRCGAQERVATPSEPGHAQHSDLWGQRPASSSGSLRSVEHRADDI